MTDLRPKFLLFGDSITQHSFDEGGWGASLQAQYSRKVDVILRGYSGYNSGWALYLLDKIFPRAPNQTPPALVTVFFGANDAALSDGSSKRQHLPVDIYVNNLKKIVLHVQSISSSTRIILITPPPVDVDGRARYARSVYGDLAVEKPERTNEVTGLYAKACKQLGASLGLPVVDLYSAILEQPSWQSHLSDGLHLAPSGNQVLFNQLLAIIEAQSWRPSLVQEAMAWDFPEHGAIDGANPGAAFKKFEQERSGLLP